MIEILKILLFKRKRKSLNQIKIDILEQYDPILRDLEKSAFAEKEIDFIDEAIINNEESDPFQVITDYMNFSLEQREVNIRNFKINILYLNRYHICFYTYKELSLLFEFIENYEYKIQNEINIRLRGLYMHCMEKKLHDIYIVNSYGDIGDA